MAAIGWLAPLLASQAAFGDTDTTFGTSTEAPGFTIVDLGGAADRAQDVVTGINDRIYTLGVRQAGGTPATIDLVVSRFDKDGTPDETFGTDGNLTLPTIHEPPGNAYHFDVDDQNQRIYVSAAGCVEAGCFINVGRFLMTTGEPDTTYGVEGFRTFITGGEDSEVDQVLVLSNHKLLILWQNIQPDERRTFVTRLNEDGTIDENFGNISRPGHSDVSASVCDDSPFMTLGRPAVVAYITAAARTSCTAPRVPALTRIDAAGQLDGTFGNGGHVVGDFGTGDIVGFAAQDQIGGGIAYAMANITAGPVLHIDIIELNDNGTRNNSVPPVSGTYDAIDPFTPGPGVFQTDGKLVFAGTWRTAADNTDLAITRIQGSPRMAHAPRFAEDVELEQPFVGFATASASVNESAGTATITVTLSKRFSQDVTVPFTLGGSATRTIDYNIVPDRFVVPAGQTTASITVSIINDAVEEADEAILFTLGTPENAKSNPPSGPLLNAFILNIEDDDLHVTPPPVTGDGSGSLDWLLLSGLLGAAGLRRKSLRAR